METQGQSINRLKEHSLITEEMAKIKEMKFYLKHFSLCIYGEIPEDQKDYSDSEKLNDIDRKIQSDIKSLSASLSDRVYELNIDELLVNQMINN